MRVTGKTEQEAWKKLKSVYHMDPDLKSVVGRDMSRLLRTLGYEVKDMRMKAMRKLVQGLFSRSEKGRKRPPKQDDGDDDGPDEGETDGNYRKTVDAGELCVTTRSATQQSIIANEWVGEPTIRTARTKATEAEVALAARVGKEEESDDEVSAERRKKKKKTKRRRRETCRTLRIVTRNSA